MKTLGCIILVALLAATTAQGAPGDWNVYMDASSVSRVTVIGDSLWCGTRGGILLFDLGDSTFTTYLDGLDLRSNDITAVTVDGRGSIWAAMRTAGIARIDDPDGAVSVKEYTEALNGILSDSVICVLRVEDDLYYGSTGGAAKFFNNIPSLEPVLTDSTAGRTVHDMVWDSSGDLLWVACEDGIASFNRGTFEYVFYDIGEVLSVCISGGEVYCVSGIDILHLGDGSWPPLGGGLPMDPVTVSSGGGELFCITPERVYLWNGSYWAAQATNELKSMILENFRIGWTRNILGALAVDGSGVPWCGGFYEEGSRGIYLTGFTGTDWTSFQPEGLSHNLIVALDCDPSGNVWASTGKFGISLRSTAGSWTSYTKIRSDVGHDDALSYYINNLALLYDSQGFLWCNALDFDLDRIDVGDPLDKDDDVWLHFAVGTGTIASDRFIRAIEDPGGNRWFMSDNAAFESGMWGVNIANQAGDDWLNVDPGSYPMEGGNIFDCAFDDQGVYFAIRGYGVMYWRTWGFDWSTLVSGDNDNWITILDEDQLPSTELWSIERGPDGSIWVGTSAGLVRYSQGAIDSFTVKTSAEREGLIGGTVYDLAFDGRGGLWVATNKGMNRIDQDGTITAAYTTALEWQNELNLIYRAEEVISPLPDHSCRALAYDPSSGYIWIGTENGLARMDANEPVEITMPMSDMILYPNPAHAARGDNVMRIARISGPVDIRVYNLEGELVHEAFGVIEGGVAWDLLTLNGYQASSGVYIVQVKGTGGTSMRKVAVIR
ncbi:MAG: T9SS type A sorting domain-containing protein [Candidatus Krumholzibacteria bacterium]|nr:T9SS type A sorting domain-containing protein [Candidatus Krumholzibacteria bacterium]